MPLTIIEDRPRPTQTAPSKPTHETLSSPQFQSSSQDRTKRIEHFVRTQRDFVAFYLSEGRTYAAKWRDQEGDSIPKITGSTASAAMGAAASNKVQAFGSPILKPRNPIAATKREPKRGDNAPTDLTFVYEGESGEESQPLVVPPRSPSPVQPKGTTSKPKPSKNDRKKQAPQSTEENIEPIRPHNLAEAERIDRLAERRARRSAKRQILQPLAQSSSNPSIHESGDSAAEQSDLGKSSKKPKRKGKAKKKKTIHPGVALMQSFSAKNLGTSRLTLQPSSCLGLFNKGKSSSIMPKVDLSRNEKHGSRTKPHKSILGDITFSEFKFLNHKASPLTLAHTTSGKRKSRPPSDSSNPTNSSNEHLPPGLSIGVTVSKERTHKRTRRGIESGEKGEKNLRRGTESTEKADVRRKATKVTKPKSASPSSVSSSSSSSSKPGSLDAQHEPLSETAEIHQQPDDASTKRRYWSPPWEIDGELIGEPGSTDHPQKPTESGPAPPQHRTSVGGMTLDITGKWGIEMPSRTVPDLQTCPAKRPDEPTSTSRFFTDNRSKVPIAPQLNSSAFSMDYQSAGPCIMTDHAEAVASFSQEDGQLELKRGQAPFDRPQLVADISPTGDTGSLLDANVGRPASIAGPLELWPPFERRTGSKGFATSRVADSEVPQDDFEARCLSPELLPEEDEIPINLETHQYSEIGAFERAPSVIWFSDDDLLPPVEDQNNLYHSDEHSISDFLDFYHNNGPIPNTYDPHQSGHNTGSDKYEYEIEMGGFEGVLGSVSDYQDFQRYHSEDGDPFQDQFDEEERFLDDPDICYGSPCQPSSDVGPLAQTESHQLESLGDDAFGGGSQGSYQESVQQDLVDDIMEFEDGHGEDEIVYEFRQGRALLLGLERVGPKDEGIGLEGSFAREHWRR